MSCVNGTRCSLGINICAERPKDVRNSQKQRETKIKTKPKVK